MTNIADQEASEEVVGVRLNRWCTVSPVVVMLPPVSWPVQGDPSRTAGEAPISGWICAEQQRGRTLADGPILNATTSLPINARRYITAKVSSCLGGVAVKGNQRSRRLPRIGRLRAAFTGTENFLGHDLSFPLSGCESQDSMKKIEPGFPF